MAFDAQRTGELVRSLQETLVRLTLDPSGLEGAIGDLLSDLREERVCASGEVDGCPLSLGLWVSREGVPGFFVRVEAAHDSLEPIVLRRAQRWMSAENEDRIRSTDLVFDGVVSAFGPVPETRALLDARMRARVLELFYAPIAIEELRFERGAVLMRALADGASASDDMAGSIRALVGVADALNQAPRGALQRLLGNTVKDWHKAVREANGDVLLELLQDVELTDRARILSYRAIAEAGLSLTKHRVLALKRLASFPAEEVIPTMERMLATHTKPLLRVAIEYLGSVRHREAAPRLVELAPMYRGDIPCRIALALGSIGDASFEPTLIEMLSREDEHVRIAAAEALRSIGTIRAISPLRASVRGVLAGREMRGAVRGAIASILERSGAGAGQLSLADLEELRGELSLDPASDEGALSLTGSPARKRS